MALISQTPEKLKEVFSEIYRDYTDEFMAQHSSPAEMIKDFKGDLQIANYTGDDNFDHILWFLKGLNLKRPEPLKRYVETAEYKAKKFDEKMRKQIREKRIQQDLSDFPKRLNVYALDHTETLR
jgi:hypothetical protein